MDDGGRGNEQGEETVTEDSEEVTASESEESRDGNEFRKRTSGAESPTIAEDRIQERGQRVVVRNENPVFFWLWFMAIMSTLTLVFLLGTNIVNENSRIEILSMPTGVREHFEAGKLMKVEVGEDRIPVKVFARASSHEGVRETVLLFHGLGSSSFSYRKLIPLLAARKIATLAVDLPGAGLSEKSCDVPNEENSNPYPQVPKGFFQIRLEALKALLVEGFSLRAHGESSENEFLTKLRSGNTAQMKEWKKTKVLALGPDELGQALDQIVASLEVAPVHLVMHDTGVEVGLAWASQNPTKVASLTFVDSVPRLPSLPFWLFKVPVIGSFIAHSDLAFRCVLRYCCFSPATAESAENHDYLLRSSDGLRAVLASLGASNSSMDVAGWASHSVFEGIPKQILWSSGWSKEWQSEGEQLAVALSGTSFHYHHGGRWPQEDAAPELAELIAEFVNSLPSSVRQHVSYKALPDVDELLYEMAKGSGNSECSSSSQDDRINHRHHHSHEQELGRMEGLGQGPGVGHGGWVI